MTIPSSSDAHRPRRHAGAAACVVLAALAAAPLHGRSGAEDPAALRIERVLAELRGAHEGSDVLLARRIGALGRPAVPVVLDRLAQDAATRLAAPDAERSGPEQRGFAVLLGAIAELPRAEVRAEAERRLARAPSREVRAAAMLALAAFGDGGELAALLAIGEPALDAEGLETAFDARVGEACRELARRDATTWARAAALAPTLSTAAQLALLRAAASDAGEDALGMLARCLDALRSRRVDVLVALQVASQRAAHPVDERVREAVRRVLDDSDEQVVAQAVLLCGRFEDAGAAGALVERLESPSASIRGNAHWALRRISGLGLRDDAPRWRAWLRDERAWWSERYEHVRAALNGRDAYEARQAVLEFGRRRLDRDRLALELVPVLAHEETGTAVIAASAIGALRSRAALPGLRAAHEGAPLALREAIELALASIEAPPASDAPRTSARQRTRTAAN
ncbi:MAG: hypothetical protein IPJ77_07170 [Planctomycetes bacterium]|nr:hypothetical protein [Planctomycetota bacterium]